jgi:hypothetical protein
MESPPTDSRPVRRGGCWGCLTLLVVVPALFLGWCHYNPSNRFPEDALDSLENDPRAVFFSIDPWPDNEEDETVGFRGHKIMGQMVLESPDDRKFVRRELDRATRGAWDEMACFDPRHAFRATGPAGTYDFLVCFSCGQAIVRMPDGSRRKVLVSGKADVFNHFLKEHQVPLPDR